MARLNRWIEKLATTDFLTDLVNRRRFFERLAAGMGYARGHDSGDRVLKDTAIGVRELLRSSDFAARFGGDGFMILLCETPIEAAMALAEAVREKIADVAFEFEFVGTVSPSFGVAQWNHEENAHALINRVGQALYLGKERDRKHPVRWRSRPP